MTYEHYIRKNGMPDSMESWTEYLSKYLCGWEAMNPAMQATQAKRTFGTRFAIKIGR